MALFVIWLTVFVSVIPLFTPSAFKLMTDVEEFKNFNIFVANKCCYGGKCLETSYNETFLLPRKLFKIKNYNGGFSLETTSSLRCDGEIEEIHLNLRDEGKFHGHSDGFYGKDKLWFNDRSYSRKDFCISNISDEKLSLKLCKRKCSVDNPCIRRCCRRERLWYLEHVCNGECFESEGEFWNPLTTHKETGGLSKEPTFLYSEPVGDKCFYITRNRVPSDIDFIYQRDFRIAEDGAVWHKIPRRPWQPLKEGYYCIEYVAMNSVGPDLFSPSIRDQTLVRICGIFVDQVSVNTLIGTFFYLVIFTPFYALTTLVYLMLKDKERVHRWTIVVLTVSLTFNIVLIDLEKFLLFSKHPGETYFTTCTVIGILTNFSFLCGLTSLTAFNVDIWVKFRSANPVSPSWNRLWIYLTFVFLPPLVVVGTGVTLDLIYLDDTESDVITPQYGIEMCTMEQYYIPWIFQYGPLCLILLLNVSLYLNMGHFLLRERRLPSQTQRHRDSLCMGFCLLLVLGIPWLAEMITWIVPPDENQPITWFKYLFDLITVFKPVLTFYVLLRNPDVMSTLISRWSWMRFFFCQAMPQPAVPSGLEMSDARPSQSTAVSQSTLRN